MVEKISDILFRPSTLIRYKKTKMYKVLLYLILLTLFSLVVPVIETFKFQGYIDADQAKFEERYLIDFKKIYEFPNCKVESNELICENENEQKEVGLLSEVIPVSIVFDMDNTMKLEPNVAYIKFTKDNFRIANNYLSYYVFEYDELPKSWQNVDFEAIKNSTDPEQAFFHVFAGGIAELKQEFIGIDLTSKFISTFFFMMFEVLFYSLIFYLFVGRKIYKFKEVFKVSVFAYTLPVIIGLFFSLLGIPLLNSTFLSILAIIYIYIALFPKMKEDLE